MCVAESLCCSLETIMTLLIICTSVQNKKFKKNTLAIMGHRKPLKGEEGERQN